LAPVNSCLPAVADCVPRTLQARRSALRGGIRDVMAWLGGLGHSLPYLVPIPGQIRGGARGYRNLDPRASPRENHGDANFAGHVANRVGARHCVDESYSYGRRLTRRAERTDWPA